MPPNPALCRCRNRLRALSLCWAPGAMGQGMPEQLTPGVWAASVSRMTGLESLRVDMVRWDLAWVISKASTMIMYIQINCDRKQQMTPRGCLINQGLWHCCSAPS